MLAYTVRLTSLEEGNNHTSERGKKKIKHKQPNKDYYNVCRSKHSKVSLLASACIPKNVCMCTRTSEAHIKHMSAVSAYITQNISFPKHLPKYKHVCM